MRLVQFDTLDGLRLNGLLAEAHGAYGTVIHIHGKCGNFYENKFVKLMYQVLPELGLNFLAFNNRGTGCYTEAYRRGEVAYIGTAVEKFEDSLLDLAAAVDFAKQLGHCVILQGHSFGCEKVTLYGLRVQSDLPLVLLSPSDAYSLQQKYIHPESVEHQINRLAETSSSRAEPDWLPQKEYGIRSNRLEYSVPITRSALLNLLTGPAFKLFRTDLADPSEVVANPTFVYLGTADDLQVSGIPAMEGWIARQFSNSYIRIYRDADHHLRPIIEKVLADIVAWIRNIVGPT